MSAPGPLRWLFRLLGGVLGLAVAGCDDGTVITRVMVFGDARSFFILSGPDGLASEVHGAPFPGMTPDQVAQRLRAPADLPTGIRFRGVRPGEAHEGPRLVLVFNPLDPIDGVRNCQRTTEARVDKPREVGFAVTATLCNKGALVATAHMEATKTRADDPAEFTRVMQLLLMQIATKPG